MDRALYAVIMAGGSGTRFWPASRRSRPKQFLPIAGEETLIARTAARIEPLIPRERILVVAGSEHAALVREALPWLAEENLLLEPRGRNTLPCVALVAAELQRRDPHSVQVVLPADHVIAPEEDFRTTLSAAAEEAGRPFKPGRLQGPRLDAAQTPFSWEADANEEYNYASAVQSTMRFGRRSKPRGMRWSRRQWRLPR